MRNQIFNTEVCPWKMTGKIIIKRMLSDLLSYSGIYSLLEQFYFSNKAFILMYHRILESADNQPCFVQPGMFVTTASFEKQIVFLRDRYEVVFLEELVEKAQKGEDVGKLCAITFDDGWRDNFSEAFPVLVKYRVPATIFLATGYVGADRMLWPEEVCYYLGRNMIDKFTYENVPPSYIRFREKISKYRKCIRETFFDRSIEILKGYLPGEREEILGYFRDMLKADPKPRQMLNWDEAQEMLSSGLVRFGSHTVNHEILDQISLEDVQGEISLSREEIEYRLGDTVRAFAYPNGNYNESIRMALEECGYDAAVTTRKGFFDSNMSLMEIPRIAMHEDVSSTIPMFRSRILFSKF